MIINLLNIIKKKMPQNIKHYLLYLFPNVIKLLNKTLEKHKQIFLSEKKFQHFFKWAVENKYFDYSYYNSKYSLNLDPYLSFKFFIKKGFLLNHNPSQKFSSMIYYSLRPDVQKDNINPLLHFYQFGQKEDPLLVEKFSNLIIDENGFETPRKKESLELQKFTSHKNIPKIFAFYLPGFHEDEFNNKFWGKGFTEWDNLKKNNKPLFMGHKYPLEPFDYYNLKDENIIRKQCKLAKNSGIDGFYIFLYDFGKSGHPLYSIIPKLIQILTEEKLEFCFEWANEPWTRRWDGLSEDILIDQDKNPSLKQIKNFIKRISQFLHQKNYLSIDGKKYFSIYRPNYFNNSVNIIKQIKNEFKKNKLDIHLSACKTFSVNDEILVNSDYDSITEYPPHPLTNNVDYYFQTKNFGLTNLWCYKKFFIYYAKYLQVSKHFKKRIFRTIIPSWDNTPRKGEKADLYINYSSSNFIKFLSTVISDEMKNKNKDKVIFINSWNEWGEGANIEPDKQYGYWKLNCIAKVKNNFICSELHELKNKNTFFNNNIRLALVHVYSLKDYEYLLKLINKYKIINFFVTIPKFVFNDNIKIPNCTNLIIKTVHNEERDFNVIYQSKFINNLNKFKIISKMHFKNRDQTDGRILSKNESYKLVEEQLKINSSIKVIKENKFICNQDWIYENQYNSVGSNEFFINKILSEFKYSYKEFMGQKFVTGGIWTIVDNSFAYIDFVNHIDNSNFILDNFHIPADGGYLHALERITFFHFKKYFFELKNSKDYI